MGDTEDHDVILIEPLGRWFARCKAENAYPKLITVDDLTANERINLDEIMTEHGLDAIGPTTLVDYQFGVKYFDLWRDEFGGSASVNFPGHEFDLTMGVEVNPCDGPVDVHEARSEASYAGRVNLDVAPQDDQAFTAWLLAD
jgi:hypothetical protein